MSVGDRIRERIEREGPITFAAFVEAALYDPEGGFFTSGHGAGRRRGDFVTSVEVGPLFGSMVARALERWWERLGRPDPFVVIDAGAGRGQLARDVLRDRPAFAPALRYVLVERAAALRAEHHDHLPWEPPEDVLGPVAGGAAPAPAAADGAPGAPGAAGPAHEQEDDDDAAVPARDQGPLVTSLPDLPAVPVTGVVIANELLDNLPFRIVQRSATGWDEVRVGLADGRAGGAVGPGALAEVLVPAEPDLAELVAGWVGDLPGGARLPVPVGAGEWLREARRGVRRGGLVVLDYVVPIAELVTRGAHGWLRTYRAHERGGPPIEAPGSQDITIDLPEPAVLRLAATAGWALEGPPRRQADWLGELGLAERVADARHQWEARAHVGDLEALRARSVASEAAALTDPAGLGSHWVGEFHSR
jgi:SAM-dependent MidA family methyltransferase